MDTRIKGKENIKPTLKKKLLDDVAPRFSMYLPNNGISNQKANKKKIKCKSSPPLKPQPIIHPAMLSDDEDMQMTTSTPRKVTYSAQGSLRDNCGDINVLSSLNLIKISRSMKKPPNKVSNDNGGKIGLTLKDKNNIILKCEAAVTVLREVADEAIRSKKIFVINGQNYDAVRDALVERGWVEKIQPNVLDVSKVRRQHFSDASKMEKEVNRLLLATFVDKCNPNFIWNTRESLDYEFHQWLKYHNVYYNKLDVDSIWTTKQGLCAYTKNAYYVMNVPRTYASFDRERLLEFENDYKLTACTSLLKWVLYRVADDYHRSFCKFSGTVPIESIGFAIDRCKEYLYKKRRSIVDKLCIATIATPERWSSFLKEFHSLMEKKDNFGLDIGKQLPLYLEEAKYVLKEMVLFRPQLTCEGSLNVWIIKPSISSRGRGIRITSKLDVLTTFARDGKYVLQKYIEEPLLIHATKFDIRQYCLVTGTSPLVIWMYRDCYLKFSSQKYNLNNFHESIHLTNHSLQKKYKNCKNRHPDLPKDNMWDLESFKHYLSTIGKDGIWDDIIYPGMKDNIKKVMLGCQKTTTSNKKRFELYGCDFILDEEYKPWLIEINAAPTFIPTTKVTTKIFPEVLTDTIKVVIDIEADNRCCSTGKFECIYM